PHRLGRQGDTQGRRPERDLSAVFPRQRRGAGARPRQSAAGARAAFPPAGGGPPRQRPGRQWPLGRKNRRAADQALPAGGAVEGATTATARLSYGFRRATARAPIPAELQILEKGLNRYWTIYRADPEAARQLMAHGDSPRNDQLDPVELAVYASVATILLNLD